MTDLLRAEARELLGFARRAWGLVPAAAEELEAVVLSWIEQRVDPVSQIELGEVPEDRPKARTSDPTTSQAAAQNGVSIRRGQRRRILEILLEQWRGAGGGLTAEEVSERASIPLNSASTRLSELSGRWVRQQGTRLTSTNTAARVYVITIEAIEALERGVTT